MQKKSGSKTATERSILRRRRAARVLPTITLDEQHDTMLRSVIEPTGEAVTDWVRRMIREQFAALDLNLTSNR